MKETQTFLPTDELESFLEYLLPEACEVQVDQILMQQEELIFVVRSTQVEGTCPLCGGRTARVHSRDLRSLQDLPWSTFPARLRLHVRRFFCLNASCPRQIFVERLPQLAEPSARRPSSLRYAICAV